MSYAQAEDDCPRIEANYLTNRGRTAEADGEKAIWQDLRARLYVSDSELKADYARSPATMRRLMKAWTAGLNSFLAAHPNVPPGALVKPKDPLEYVRKLRFHQSVESVRDYGVTQPGFAA